MNLWWIVLLGTGIALALAFGFVLLLFFHERTKRKIERERAAEIRNLLHESESVRKESAMLSQKMMNLQEEERARISRELHDEIGQILTAIHTNLQIVLQDLRSYEKSTQDRISESLKWSREVMQRIRRVIRELRPIDFQEAGLIPSLTKYISEFETRTGIHTILSYDPLEDDLSLNYKVTIFRIVQECLTNIARHSGASEAKVSLLEKVKMEQKGAAADSHTVTYLEISDNGNGMPPLPDGDNDVVARQSLHDEGDEFHIMGSGGIGLSGIQERVKLLSGTIQISSAPHEGTQIAVTLPGD